MIDFDSVIDVVDQVANGLVDPVEATEMILALTEED